MNFVSPERESTADLNIYNTTYGDKSSIKTIINYFIENSPLNKIFALVLFVISAFTSLSEIISYTFIDFAMILLKTENFSFSSDIAVMSCQLFSFFVFAVAINIKRIKSSIFPALFFVITILIKLLMEMQLLSTNLIYCCFILLLIFSIVLLMIYDSIEKKNLKQK